jgi:KEOPS complex subunit Cgi121
MRLVEGTATVEDVDAFLAELAAVGEATGCTVQAFDARYVMGREHLERAVELADRAIERGEAVADDRAVEILLYAAGRRQINRALEMGVGEGECPVVVVVDGDDEAAAAEQAGELLAPVDTLAAEHVDPVRVRSFFDVSDEEVAAVAGDLQDLVLERVALLDVGK